MVAELKGLMERVNSVKASRDTIEASLRDATVDICTYDPLGELFCQLFIFLQRRDLCRLWKQIKLSQTKASPKPSSARRMVHCNSKLPTA